MAQEASLIKFDCNVYRYQEAMLYILPVWNPVINCILGIFPGGSDGEESACKAGDLSFDPCVGKIPWRREWQPTNALFLFINEYDLQKNVKHLLWNTDPRDEIRCNLNYPEFTGKKFKK